MTRVLFRKLLYDIRVSLPIVCLLLLAFQILWAHVAYRISGQVLTKLERAGVSPEMIRSMVFDDTGKVIQTLMGGEDIKIERASDLMTVAYVHPLTLILLTIWAVGRASGAIAGEIDRGTMELLLAQPIRRSQVILAHLFVDLVTTPALCLSMWFGTVLGTWIVGLSALKSPSLHVDPLDFWPALLNVGCYLLALSGFTLWLSAAGRFRNRVLGLAVLITLVQFIVNVIGQLWPYMEPLRPYTVFYHYQPQPMILNAHWFAQAATWLHLGVLLGVALVGYLLAWWTFCKRDLPAPL